MKRRLLVSLMVFAGCTTIAQQLPIIGQFQYFQTYFNPAAAGTGEGPRASTLHRVQWRGLDRAPNTQLLCADMPFKNKFGAALTLSHDLVSIIRQVDAMVSLSYKVNLTGETYWSNGLRIGTSFVRGDINNLFYWEPGDQVIDSYIRGTVLPRIGYGTYLYHPNYYVGASLPDLFTIDHSGFFLDETTNEKTIRRNVFVTGGAKFEVSEYISFLPNAMIKYYPYRRSPVYFNVNAALEMNQTVVAGIGYGFPDIFTGFGSVNLTPKLKLGFRYEYSPNKIRLGKFGTNEIMLAYGIY